jgi:hypothetical protein
MSANDAQRTESIYNISDFEFFEIGEFTTEAQSRRVGEESISPQRTQSICDISDFDFKTI